MAESSSKSTPYEVRVYPTCDGRVRMIVPVLAEGYKPGVSYQDPDLQRMLGEDNVDRRIVQMSVFYDNIESFSEAFPVESNKPMVLVLSDDGSGFFTPLKFEDFNDLMINCNRIIEERVFGVDQEEFEEKDEKSATT